MAYEGESLGKARLDLEVNLAEFRKNMTQGERLSGGMGDSLKALASIAEMAQQALGDVQLSRTQALENERVAARIEGSVGRVGRAAMEATQHLQEVKLGAAQAAETDAAGDVIDRKLKDITGNANEARRAVESVRLVGGVPGRSGVGVGPFGSGFGRVGVFGTLVGLGAAAAPSAAPGAVGLLAAIPSLATGAAGAIGTLVLAFQGMGKAIGGDYKAFQQLQPAQKQFVQTVRSMIPWVDRLKQISGTAMFPGLTAGLRSALSPGTVATLTKGIEEFAQAIGRAGEAWGRYFGSAQFQRLLGPLLASGARNLIVLSDAVMRLFDAFGVLGRAAIPLTNWLADLADKGSRFADSWLRAQSASGGLARAMSAAQTSLRGVGALFAAIAKAVFELGRALYPVSQVALKDLTAGFAALASWIERNRQTISSLVGAALKDLVAVIETAVSAIGKWYAAMKADLGPTGAKAIVLALGATIALIFNPTGTAIGLAILAAGEIIRHWQTVKTWFVDFGRFMENVFSASWTAIKGIFNLAIYGLLKELQLLVKGLEQGLGWIPGIGGKIKRALESVDSFIEDFRRRGVAEMQQAGAEMGSAWGDAFRQNMTAQVNAALDKANKEGGVVLRRSGVYVPAHAKTKPKAPSTTPPPSSGPPFGTPPPFDKNVPAAPKPKAPPLLPLKAQHALSLAEGNASRASTLGNVGGTAARYLENELADLSLAAKLIREKYDRTAGKIHEQLFKALTGVLDKMRTVRKRIKDALKKDYLAGIQFRIDLDELAMASAKEGSAAYKRAELNEEKLLRAEIAYLDKRVRNKKLSLKLREEALQAELSARQQLNALIGQTSDVGKVGENEAQFLSSFQQIYHSFAPNAMPTPPSTAQLETKGYETVDQLRRVNEKLERLIKRTQFPASGYASDSAQAAFG